MRFIIAGTHSGTGKTTITAGIIKALRKRGFEVQPFKVGPDYIDPGYHTLASDRQTRNLDGWMLTREQVQEVMSRNIPRNGIGVVEGVMGLYDGYTADGEEGSTAQIAKITNSPVFLIIDGAKMARSAAAVALGYQTLDPEVPIAGLIFNRLGGERHYNLLKKAVEPLNIPVLGYFPREPEVLLPERHLGLVPTSEMSSVKEFINYWGNLAERCLDLDAMGKISEKFPAVPVPENTTLPRRFEPARCNLAVARDDSFTFYYPENLELLGARGASIIEVNLLKDSSLPVDCHGLYIGGGFPEIFARELSENKSMVESVKEAAQRGMPIYGECGGFMYLTRGIKNFHGRYFPLTGIFPCDSVMTGKRQALGYVAAKTRISNFLTLRGEESRGHEFHWSEITRDELKEYVYRFPNKGNREDGLLYKNVLGSYVHLHFYSNPVIAERFVKACTRYAQNL